MDKSSKAADEALKRLRVETRHETIASAVCGEMFTQARRNAKTCSNACRQKLFRMQQKAETG